MGFWRKKSFINCGVLSVIEFPCLVFHPQKTSVSRAYVQQGMGFHPVKAAVNRNFVRE